MPYLSQGLCIEEAENTAVSESVKQSVQVVADLSLSTGYHSLDLHLNLRVFGEDGEFGGYHNQCSTYT